MSVDKAQEVFNKLNQPFDPSDIKWKPQTVDYKKKQAMAVAHADPRAYIDRLNEAVGPGGWTQEFRFIATPFTKYIKGKKAWGSPADAPVPEDKLVPGNKVIVACKLTIHGVGVHESTGDCDASDENAVTTAEAQAFKRACLSFGLGRYLYDLPKQMIGFNNNEFTEKPTLPDWAIPKVTCEDCHQNITSYTHGNTEYNVSQIVANSIKVHNKKLCADCQRALSAASKGVGSGRLKGGTVGEAGEAKS